MAPAFTTGATINAFGVAVASLDVGASGGGTTSLLAFTPNINAGNANLTTIVPQVDVFTVNTTGANSGEVTFQPTDSGVTNAHFIQNTGVVGVVSPAALSFYSYSGQLNTYTEVNTLGSSGALNDFTAVAGGSGYQIVAVGAATNRFFYTTGNPSSETGLPAFVNVDTPFEPRVISFVAGDGGHGGHRCRRRGRRCFVPHVYPNARRRRGSSGRHLPDLRDHGRGR